MKTLSVSPYPEITRRRSELVRSSLEGGGRWIQVRLVSSEPLRKKNRSSRTLWRRVLKITGWAFWFFCLGGFLAAGAAWALRSERPGKKDFFYALDCHKFLWYMGAVWKRNP